MKTLKYIFISLFLFSLTSCKNKETISLIDLGNEVDIHSDLQQDYLFGDFSRVSLYAKGNEELSKPRDIEFSWKVNKKIDDKFLNYQVKISESNDLKDAKTYEVKDNNLSLTNFKIATTYYWSVTANYENSSYVSEISTFTTTSNAPRNLNIDGVTNFRDLGGWETSDGKRVKQGMIYRSGRLNMSHANPAIIEVSEEGLDVLNNDLKIKSEIDIRKVSNNEVGMIDKSVIGEQVNYLSLPMEYNGNILEINIEATRDFFNYLGEEDNYPLVFHCNIGTDRTGMLSYLINGLLGVEKEDLYTDYLFSNFGKIGGSRDYLSILSSYGATIDAVEGSSLNDKISTYLISIGVKNQVLETIKRIMIED